MLSDISKKTNSFKFAAILAGLLFLGTLSIIVFVNDEYLRMVLTDIIFPIVNLLAVVALFYGANRSSLLSKQLGLAWIIIAIAQLSYAIADIIWGVLESGMGKTPFPSIADGFYLAYYPIFLLGIVLLPSKKQLVADVAKTGLDMGVILITTGLVFWNFVIGPIVASEVNEPLLSGIISLAYPVGDVLLVGALITLLYRKVNAIHQSVFYLLLLTAIVMVITDGTYSYQSLNGTYVSGGLTDIGFIAAYLLSGLAGVMQATTVGQRGQEKATHTFNISPKLEIVIVYIPYVWVAIAFLLIALGYYFPMAINRTPLVIGVGCVILMVVIRQVISLVENNQLNSKLNFALDQVKRQKSELECTNRELTEEITTRKRAEERLSFDALHDGLTGLPNRVLFMDRLGRAIEYSKRRPDYLFSVLFLDLDQFKVVNDSLGHGAGDKLLIAISERLENKLRTSDTVARLGGDEFVLLLENILKENESILVANRILDELKTPFFIQNHELHISASIGIVSNVSGYHFPEEVLRDADIAMYRAKATGKARYEIFSSSLRTQVIRRLELENELRSALTNSEFQLYYQPIVSLDRYELTGFEALIRWKHPEKGIILPNDFIPVAEESGLIQPIGKWILEEACRQMQIWRNTFPNQGALVINVNISGKQFTHAAFFQQVEDTLKRSGLDAYALKLEITETALIENSTIANEVFRKLSAIGVQLQIDDFGTGYSSLGYLQHFPIHTLKIDRTFINEIKEGKKGAELIRAMVLMANDLGMDTVAEGVETQDQLMQLRTLDCKYVQGYLIAKPMDKLTVDDYLSNKKPLPVE